MTDVIRRKIDQARVPLVDGAPGADRGWRLALARAARDTMALDLEVRRMTVTRASLTEVMETAPDRVLVALLDGPEGGLGVLLLSTEVTAALIEMQTLGRLAPQPPAARKPTRIDAAMVAGVIDAALAGLEDALLDEADLCWAGGFRYASFLEEMRPLTLLLEEDVYRVLRAEVALRAPPSATMGPDKPPPPPRIGEVVLVLPAAGRGERPVAATAPEVASAPQFAQDLSAQVLQVDARLEAVIGRLTLPLRHVMALQPGEVLPLPQAGLDNVVLETPAGRPVAFARLGQHRGMRAVKLAEAYGGRGAMATPAAPPRPVDPPGVEADLRVAS